MKLESLKSSKFEAFKENKLINAFKVLGGVVSKTTHGPSQSICDTYNSASEKDGVFNKADLTDTDCGQVTTTDLGHAGPMGYK